MIRYVTKISLNYLYGCFKYFPLNLFLLILLSLTIISTDVHAEIPIPKQSDWTNQGTVVSEGTSGSWDRRFNGAISPGAMVKKGGTYFLYYIGADGNRSSDGGPRHRAVGVATSTDGINFTKYGGNPIIEFLPNNNEEEGIFSVAAMVDNDGTVLLYYGAMDAGSPTSTSVNSDARLATSNDGYDFSGTTMVLDHDDSGIAGYGDELMPVGAFRSGSTYYLYYINQSWRYYLAWGSSPTNMPNSQVVISGGVNIVGGGDVVRLGSSDIVLFLVRTDNWSTIIQEARSTSVNSPTSLNSLDETYNWGQGHTLVYYDNSSDEWFMYRESGGKISVRTVLESESEVNPPSPPTGLHVVQ